MINERNAKYFCSDDISLIENYDKAINDPSQTWCIHHRLETDCNISRKKLIQQKRYYNVPSSELIFLTSSEHSYIHNIGKKLGKKTKQKLSELHKGKHLSEEHKYKIKEWLSINGSPFKDKHHSDETKQKLREAHIGKPLTKEHKHKLSIAMTGERNPMYGKSAMLGKHHKEESKEKTSASNKKYNKEHPEVIEARAKHVRNTKFMHNNVICKRVPLDKVEEYLNNGFVFGMLNTGK